MVRVDDPSVSVSKAATADGTGFQFLGAHTGKDITVDTTSFDGTARTVTLYITDLPNALYRVRVNSVNPNSGTPAPSEWSAVIGTGEAWTVF